MISIRASQPAIHSAALGLEGVRSISGGARHAAQAPARLGGGRAGRYRPPHANLQRANVPRQRCAHRNFGVGAPGRSVLRDRLWRNFPPSTLLYIEGLVDIGAKLEIEVTAFVTTT